ncbi:MAG: efflux RND transporter periplasmic adaptor subunit [Pseudohongiella sp.]|uniref:efflux RND transporter periplasmic adaptor subunit n=1 Tax=Pseudohongiella sp. TaxID=1979412 RepID=UPI0034A002B4
MKKQYLVAIGLVIVIAAWMLIPRGDADRDDRYASADIDRTVTAVADDGSSNVSSAADFTVRAMRSRVDTFTQSVSVRGRTQAFRLVDIRAETSGRVVATPAARGARVQQGDVLCELAIDTRETDLQEALSRQEQSRLEYEGGLDLQQRELISRSALAQLKTTYDAAIAAVSRAELALERTKIRAPFTGIVETRAVEVGDYMDMGGQCASLFDDNPMLLVGQVPEQDVNKLDIGTRVTGIMVTGDRVNGELTYLARAADDITRSYRIEVQLEPQQIPIRQGISTEILLDAAQIRAHLVPPSSVTLDDAGLLGVKTLNSDNEVEFRRVQIVGESTRIDQPGFWVTGLPEEVVLITVGQELVFEGQIVNANFDWSQL